MPSSLLPCSQMSSTIRCGLRCETAPMTPSESDAERVAYPSSARIPAISSRISASSSTTRISDATNDAFLLMLHPLLLLRLMQRENHMNDRARCMHVGFIARVFQNQFTAMVLKDLTYNGETQPRTLGAGRDIGLGQAMTLLAGQPYAVVAYRNDDARRILLYLDRDTPRRVVARGKPRADGLPGILQHVRESLCDEAPVACELDRFGRRRHLK